MTLARGTDRIESARLVLRRISAGDLDFLTRIHADPDVARYLGHGRPRSSEESLAWLRLTLASYEDFGLRAAFLTTHAMCCGCGEWFRSFTPTTCVPCAWPKDLGYDARMASK